MFNKLRLDRFFVEEDMGEFVIAKTRELRNKNKDEYIVTLETPLKRRPPTWLTTEIPQACACTCLTICSKISMP